MCVVLKINRSTFSITERRPGHTKKIDHRVRNCAAVSDFPFKVGDMMAADVDYVPDTDESLVSSRFSREMRLSVSVSVSYKGLSESQSQSRSRIRTPQSLSLSLDLV